MSGRAIVLDLDGTLTDPGPGIVRCIRHALQGLARPCPPESVLAACIGPPLRGSFAALLDTTDAALVERAMALYRERFAELGLYENEVYAAIPAALAALAAAGLRLFVATAKPAVFAGRIVRHFALDHHFSGVYGPDLDGRLDDKRELLAHLLATEQLAPTSAVMVGDRAGDVLAARANGLQSIGVLWGYGSRGELLDAGADVVCAEPAELAPAAARLLGGRGRSGRLWSARRLSRTGAASGRWPAAPRTPGPESPAVG
jgi:phosphoglycolate phosphatase